jgi:hypothetical protein
MDFRAMHRDISDAYTVLNTSIIPTHASAQICVDCLQVYLYACLLVCMFTCMYVYLYVYLLVRVFIISFCGSSHPQMCSHALRSDNDAESGTQCIINIVGTPGTLFFSYVTIVPCAMVQKDSDHDCLKAAMRQSAYTPC